MHEVENQQGQQGTTAQNVETESGHEFGDGGINEVVGWATVSTSRMMRPLPKRKKENPIETENPFEPLQPFDDEEFPPLTATGRVNCKPVYRAPGKRRMQGTRSATLCVRTTGGRLRMPPLRKGAKTARGTPARAKETGSLVGKTTAATEMEIEAAATTAEIEAAATAAAVAVNRVNRVNRWSGRKTADVENDGFVMTDAENNGPIERKTVDVENEEEDCQAVHSQANPWIADVDCCTRNSPANLMEVNCTVQDWERITLKIDSGAIDTVMPPTMAKHFPLEETERSKKGEGYLAANNSLIQHYGMRRLKGQSDAYRPMTMVAQVAGVKSALVSVHRLLEAGNKVHFERGNCYVEHTKSKIRTDIAERNGAFEVGFWIPKAQGNQTDRGEVNAGNNKSFPRQDTTA